MVVAHGSSWHLADIWRGYWTVRWVG